MRHRSWEISLKGLPICRSSTWHWFLLLIGVNQIFGSDWVYPSRVKPSWRMMSYTNVRCLKKPGSTFWLLLDVFENPSWKQLLFCYWSSAFWNWMHWSAEQVVAKERKIFLQRYPNFVYSKKSKNRVVETVNTFEFMAW